jgi:hypothetical protein
MSAPVLNASKPTAKPKSVKGEVNAAELDRGWRDAKQDEQKLRASSKQAALQVEEEQRVPAKKFVPPTPEPPAAKPARVIASTPPFKAAATPMPDVERPVPAATPRRAATPPPPLRPLMTPPAAVHRAITPPPAATTAPELEPPAAERKPAKLREPAAATPEPSLNPARLRQSTVAPAAPLRKLSKPTPAPAGEPVPPGEKPN